MLKKILRTLFVRPSDTLPSLNSVRAAAHAAVEALERRQMLTATPTLSSGATADEGLSYNLTVNANATNAQHYHVDWGDGTDAVDVDSIAASQSFTHTYADGDAGGTSRTATATLTYADGTGSATKALTVNNLPPSLMVSRTASVDEGSTFTLHLASTDLGVDGVSSWDINWGDNSGTNADGAQHVTGNPSSITHVYADGTATYAITASATDEDGTYTAATNLDSDFGTGGIATTDFGTTSDYGRAAVVQSDGKVIAAGESNGNFALVRYNTNGSLDSSFGTGGKLTTDFGTADVGNAVTLQSDGKVLVAGTTDTNKFALARYTTAGILDTTFGADDGSGTGTRTGKLTTTINSEAYFGSGSAVAVQADGKILVGGQGFDLVSGTSAADCVLVRYASDGTVDTSFGSGGKVTTAFTTGSGADVIKDVKVQSDGKIVVAGFTTVLPSGKGNFAIIRYNTDGTLDSGFGTSGKLSTDLGNDDEAFGLVIQSDGKLVVGGSTGATSSGGNFALVRYSAAGVLDTTFGSAGTGKVTTDFGGTDAAFSLGQQSDGKLLLAGYSYTNTSARNFAVARFSSSGVLDSTFGSGGKLTTGIGVNAEAHGIVVRPDGRIVVVGYSNANFSVASYDFAAAAYHPSNDVLVNDVVAAATLSGNRSVNEGGTYVLSVAGAADPGADVTSGFLINWGDGSSQTLSGTSGTVQHSFAAAVAAPNVTASAIDEEGTHAGSGSEPVSVLPSAPSDVTVSESGDDNEVGWTDASTVDDGFKVQRSVEGADFTTIATLDDAQASYTDTTAPAGSSIDYRVLAFNAGGLAASPTVAPSGPTFVPIAQLPPGDPTSPDALYFGNGETYPSGTYRVEYVGGALSYHKGTPLNNWWGTGGYKLLDGHGTLMTYLPGVLPNPNPWPSPQNGPGITFQAAQDATMGKYYEFTLTGPTQLALAIGDSEYSDNSDGATWRLLAKPEVRSVTWTATPYSALGSNTQQNGGMRIFPDKQSPTDTTRRDQVYVDATVWPIPPSPSLVYFRSYDVDDPYPDTTGEIDTNGTAGLDNLGTDPGQRGSFLVTPDYGTVEDTDSSGHARATFTVTKQPGDNFRVGASTKSTELDKINDNTVPANNIQSTAFAGALTDLLTVWRHLWVERDTMTVGSPNTGGVSVMTVTRNVASGSVLVDSVQLAGTLPGGADAFEGGVLAIPSLGIANIPIRNNSDNAVFGDTVYIPVGSLSNADVAAINGAGGTPATVTDDDNPNFFTGATLPLPDGGSLLESAFGNAYIQPQYVDAGPGSWNTRGTVPFRRHLEDDMFYAGNSVFGSRDLPSDALFWSTQVVGCFEDSASTDGDSDGISPMGAPSVASQTYLDYGKSGENGFNTSAIFLETIDDIARQLGTSASTDEAHTVVHEIGHTAGINGHDPAWTGIMHEGAPKNKNYFDNIHLRFFRGIDAW